MKNKKKDTSEDDQKYYNINVASSTECTGLKYSPALSDSDDESYSEIYDMPHAKKEK